MANTIVEKTLNVRLPLELSVQLDTLTKATGKTKSFLAIEALREYLEVQAWQLQKIKTALEETSRGEFASEKDVAKYFAKHGC